jgi:hypothetical protein
LAHLHHKTTTMRATMMTMTTTSRRWSRFRGEQLRRVMEHQLRTGVMQHLDQQVIQTWR